MVKLILSNNRICLDARKNIIDAIAHLFYQSSENLLFLFRQEVTWSLYVAWRTIYQGRVSSIEQSIQLGASFCWDLQIQKLFSVLRVQNLNPRAGYWGTRNWAKPVSYPRELIQPPHHCDFKNFWVIDKQQWYDIICFSGSVFTVQARC